MDLSDLGPEDIAVLALDGLETDELKAVEARLDGAPPARPGRVARGTR